MTVLCCQCCHVDIIVEPYSLLANLTPHSLHSHQCSLKLTGILTNITNREAVLSRIAAQCVRMKLEKRAVRQRKFFIYIINVHWHRQTLAGRLGGMARVAAHALVAMSQLDGHFVSVYPTDGTYRGKLGGSPNVDLPSCSHATHPAVFVSVVIIDPEDTRFCSACRGFNVDYSLTGGADDLDFPWRERDAVRGMVGDPTKRGWASWDRTGPGRCAINGSFHSSGQTAFTYPNC